jgi:fructose-1,6-bisphosphatase/inositol monophosphatase family enzyme
MEMSLDALESAALDFANVLRGVHGKAAVDALQPGTQHSCAGCPIAETAGGWRTGTAGWEVGPTAIYVGPRGAVSRTIKPIETPSAAAEFMAAFDAGMFPHLTRVPVAA